MNNSICLPPFTVDAPDFAGQEMPFVDHQKSRRVAVISECDSESKPSSDAILMHSASHCQGSNCVVRWYDCPSTNGRKYTLVVAGCRVYITSFEGGLDATGDCLASEYGTESFCFGTIYPGNNSQVRSEKDCFTSFYFDGHLFRVTATSNPTASDLFNCDDCRQLTSVFSASTLPPPVDPQIPTDTGGQQTDSDTISWINVPSGDTGVGFGVTCSNEMPAASKDECSSQDGSCIAVLPNGQAVVAYESRNESGTTTLSLSFFQTSSGNNILYYRQMSRGTLVNDPTASSASQTFLVYDDEFSINNTNGVPDQPTYIAFLSGPLKGGSPFKISSISRTVDVFGKQTYVIVFDALSRKAQFDDSNNDDSVQWIVLTGDPSELVSVVLPDHTYQSLPAQVARPSIAVAENALRTNELNLFVSYEAFENRRWRAYVRQICISDDPDVSPKYLSPYIPRAPQSTLTRLSDTESITSVTYNLINLSNNSGAICALFKVNLLDGRTVYNCSIDNSTISTSCGFTVASQYAYVEAIFSTSLCTSASFDGDTQPDWVLGQTFQGPFPPTTSDIGWSGPSNCMTSITAYPDVDNWCYYENNCNQFYVVDDPYCPSPYNDVLQIQYKPIDLWTLKIGDNSRITRVKYNLSFDSEFFGYMNKVDIVFLVDYSPSMISHILNLRNAVQILMDTTQFNEADVRVGFVVYADGLGSENPLPDDRLESDSAGATFNGLSGFSDAFTTDLSALQNAMNYWIPQRAEANHYTAIQFALGTTYDWRSDAKKYICVVTDAGNECSSCVSSGLGTLGGTILNNNQSTAYDAINESGCNVFIITDVDNDEFADIPNLAATYDIDSLDVAMKTISATLLSDVYGVPVLERDTYGYTNTFFRPAEMIVTYKDDLSDFWLQQKSNFEFTDTSPIDLGPMKGLSNFPFPVYEDMVYSSDPVHVSGNINNWVYFNTPGRLNIDYPNIGSVAGFVSNPLLISDYAYRTKIRCNRKSEVFVAYEKYDHGLPQIEIKGTGDFSQNSITGPYPRRITRSLSADDFVFHHVITSSYDGSNQLCDFVIDNSDITHITWQSNRDTQWEIYYANGSDIFAPVRVTTADSRSGIPRIDVDTYGRIFIVYHDNRFGPYQILMSYKSEKRVVPLLEQNAYLASARGGYFHNTNVLPLRMTYEADRIFVSGPLWLTQTPTAFDENFIYKVDPETGEIDYIQDILIDMRSIAWSRSGAFYGIAQEYPSETAKRSVSYISAMVAPQARYTHAMAFSPTLNTLMLGGTSTSEYFWSYNGNWTQIDFASQSPRPDLGMNFATAYDTVRNRLIVFGGQSLTSVPLSSTLWEFDGSSWVSSDTSEEPMPRVYHMLSYDTSRSRAVLAFGSLNQITNTTISELNSSTWSRVLNDGGAVSGVYGSSTFDNDRNVTIFFGGLSDVSDTSSIIGTLAEWNGTTLSIFGPFDPPPASSGHTIAYDSARNRTVLVGSNVTSEYDGFIWSRKSTANPSNSQYHSSCYDIVRAKTVVNNNFGTWEWNGSAWTLKTTSGPTSSHGAMVFDSSSSRSILFDYDSLWSWNGTSWQLHSSADPNNVWGASACYDSARQVTTIVGGFDSANLSYPLTSNPSSQIAEWDNNDWSQPPVSFIGPQVSRGTMAYDSIRSRHVVTGGRTVNGFNAYTWEWDGTTWSNVSKSPHARSMLSMSYDTDRNVAVVYGGGIYGGGSPYPIVVASLPNDTWEFNSDGGQWLRKTPTTSPNAYYGHATVYDSVNNVTVLFGGYSITNQYLRETWTWNGSDWTLRSTSGPPRSAYHAMAYDSFRGKTVLYGGESDTVSSPHNQTWEWDGISWVRIITAHTPPVASEHCMCYDSVRRRVVMVINQQTWEYNGSDWTLKLNGALVAGTAPAYTTSGRLVYDSTRNVSVYYGNNQTWEWNGTTWTNRSASDGSIGLWGGPNRIRHGMCYDTFRQTSLVFSGQGKLADLWEWNGTAWSLTYQGDRPCFCGSSSAFYTSRGVVVVAGGKPQDSFSYLYGPSSTWEWDGDIWTLKVTSPTIRAGAFDQSQLIYNSALDRVMTGSSNSLSFYDGTSWGNVSATGYYPPTGALISVDADGYKIAYDIARDKVIMVGNSHSVVYELNGFQWHYMETTNWPEENFILGFFLADSTFTYDASTQKCIFTGGFVYSNFPSGPPMRIWEYDHGTRSWTKKTTTKPSARRDHAMVYDASRNKSLLFGGYTYTYSGSPVGYSNQTWEWDHATKRWSLRSPATSPSARAKHRMAYDSARGVTVLFGGENGTANSETWEWNGSDWAQIPAPAPSARYYHAMAFDSSRSTTILFGGSTPDNSDETWEWKDSIWTKIITTGPVSRYGTAICYDQERQETVMFGGFDGTNYLNDTWVWNGSRWGQKNVTGPSATRFHKMCFDSNAGRRKIVMFGGQTSASVSNETWEWNGTSWTHIVLPSPFPRMHHSLSFDSVRNVAVLFGGKENGTFDETWEYDGLSWTQKFPATSPSARFGHDSCYNTNLSATLLVGGSDGANEAWSWNGTNWSMLSACGPGKTVNHSMTFDIARQRTVLFGGTADISGPWEWNGTRWYINDNSTSPTPRSRAAFAYDPSRSRSVLFGGDSSDDDTSVWEWNGTWSKTVANGPSLRRGHAMSYCGAGVLVFGGEDANNNRLGDTWIWNGSAWNEISGRSPSARYGHTISYDSVRNRAVLFGGWQGGSNAETWEFDGSTWWNYIDTSIVLEESSSFQTIAVSLNSLATSFRDINLPSDIERIAYLPVNFNDVQSGYLLVDDFTGPTNQLLNPEIYDQITSTSMVYCDSGGSFSVPASCDLLAATSGVKVSQALAVNLSATFSLVPSSTLFISGQPQLSIIFRSDTDVSSYYKMVFQSFRNNPDLNIIRMQFSLFRYPEETLIQSIFGDINFTSDGVATFFSGFNIKLDCYDHNDTVVFDCYATKTDGSAITGNEKLVGSIIDSNSPITSSTALWFGWMSESETDGVVFKIDRLDLREIQIPGYNVYSSPSLAVDAVGRLWSAFAIKTYNGDQTSSRGVRIFQINSTSGLFDLSSNVLYSGELNNDVISMAVSSFNEFYLLTSRSGKVYLSKSPYPSVASETATFAFSDLMEIQSDIIRIAIDETDQLFGVTASGAVYAIDVLGGAVTFVFSVESDDPYDPYGFDRSNICGVAFQFSGFYKFSGEEDNFHVLLEFYDNKNMIGTPAVKLYSLDQLEAFIDGENEFTPSGLRLSPGQSKLVLFKASHVIPSFTQRSYPYGFDTNQTYFPKAFLLSNSKVIQQTINQIYSFSCNKCSTLGSNIFDPNDCSYSFSMKNPTDASLDYVVAVEFYSDSEMLSLIRRFIIVASGPDLAYVQINNSAATNSYFGPEGLTIDPGNEMFIQVYPSLDSRNGMLCGINYHVDIKLCSTASCDISSSVFSGNEVSVSLSNVSITTLRRTFKCECSSNIFVDEGIQPLSQMSRWLSSSHGYADTRITDSLEDCVAPSIKAKQSGDIVVAFESENKILASLVKNLETNGSGSRYGFDYDLGIVGNSVQLSTDLYDRIAATYTRRDSRNGRGVSKSEIPGNTCFCKICDFLISAETSDGASQPCDISTLTTSVLTSDPKISAAIVKKILIRSDYVKYYTYNSSGSVVPVVGDCNIVIQIWGSPEIVAYRLRNENDEKYTDWCAFRPEISDYHTERQWTLSGVSGLKSVCIQFMNYAGIAVESCFNVIADYANVAYEINLYSDSLYSQPLPLLGGMFVAATQYDTANKTAQTVKSVYVEIIPSIDIPANAVAYDIVQQGLSDAYNLSATRQTRSDGRIVYRGVFDVHKEDNILHKDGLAKIVVRFPGLCSESNTASGHDAFTKDSFNSFGTTLDNAAEVDDLAEFRDPATGIIGTGVTIHPLDDPYFIFGDPPVYITSNPPKQPASPPAGGNSGGDGSGSGSGGGSGSGSGGGSDNTGDGLGGAGGGTS